MREEADRRVRAAEDARAPGETGETGETGPAALRPAPPGDGHGVRAIAPVPPGTVPVPVATAPVPVAGASGSAAAPAPTAVPVAPVAEASSRRAAREAVLLGTGGGPIQHARPPRRRVARLALVAGIVTGAALLVGSTAAVTAMTMPPSAGEAAAMAIVADEPPVVEQLPVPEVAQSPISTDLCSLPDFIAALESRDDEAVVIAAGGGEAFRAAVVEGRAPCIDLGDPTRTWVVVNKTRPANPLDYRPSNLVLPEGLRNIEGGALRAESAAALTSLVAAANAAGVGEIALESGFRSFQTQTDTYGRQVAAHGDQADHSSARPGYSEHQTGLAADVVACAGSCGTLDDLAATAQGGWVAAHAWEHGFIVRYVEGSTGVTGYVAEPWHLRYIGPELARAYHEGGWRSLEEFFGLPAAPGYLG